MANQHIAFLELSHYTQRRAFVMDILDGMTFLGAITKHSGRNIDNQNGEAFFYYQNLTFFSFLRAMKRSMLNDLGALPEEKLEEFRRINLYTSIETLRSMKTQIVGYIEWLETRPFYGPSENHDQPIESIAVPVENSLGNHYPARRSDPRMCRLFQPRAAWA